MKKSLGIYIHIPFCKSKCAYCDFYSFAPCGDIIDRYVAALCDHIKRLSEKAVEYSVDSIFIGGGTPTVLGGKRIAQISRVLHESFSVSDDVEFTVESNPGAVDFSDLSAMREAGVNRISFGLQSVHSNELAALSRIHTFDDFLKAYGDARAAGIDNINVDLMYGIPEQTIDSFESTLRVVAELLPEHISLYGLKIEEGTPFDRMKDSLVLPDEDEEYGMYSAAIEFLRTHGYSHYEISNYARDGKRSRHNLKYWGAEEYIGIGAAAYSYFDKKRYSYYSDAEKYISNIENGIEPIDECEEISEKESLAEYIMLRLRLSDGIELDEFKRRFSADFDISRVKRYVDAGKMKLSDGKLAFTDEGMYVSNMILSDIVEFDV